MVDLSPDDKRKDAQPAPKLPHDSGDILFDVHLEDGVVSKIDLGGDVPTVSVIRLEDIEPPRMPEFDEVEVSFSSKFCAFGFMVGGISLPPPFEETYSHKANPTQDGGLEVPIEARELRLLMLYLSSSTNRVEKEAIEQLMTESTCGKYRYARFIGV